MMALLQLLVLSALPVLLHAQNQTYEELLKIVKEGIAAAQTYVRPTENEEVLNITDSSEHDFGSYDFIIIGAGAAGSVLANRLSEIQDWEILLLDAGGEQTDFSHIPGFAFYLSSSPMNWGYYSNPSTTTFLASPNNMCQAPVGKVLGGGTVLNLKMHVRGNKQDYDGWAALGNEGWSYDEVLPYFIQMENSHVNNADEGYHGSGGELDYNYTEPSPYTSIHIEAMKEIGFSNVDINGESQIGTSQVPFTTRSNQALSGAMAFLDPIKDVRQNLTIEMNAFVTKLLIDKAQNSTTGVEFIKNGTKYVAKARKEVILSAGAYNTPQILILSGIGPREHLQKLDIETFLDLPVGKNLVDHVIFTGLQFQTNLTLFDTNNDTLETWVKEYLKGHRPLTATGYGDTVSFFNSIDENSTAPNVQFVSVVSPGFPVSTGMFEENFYEALKNNYNPKSDVFFLTFFINPKSKGTVTLRSKDPADFPLIDFNFYSDLGGEDLESVYKGILKTISLLDTKSYKSINGTLAPSTIGCEDYEKHSRQWWYCTIRTYSSTGYHPTGTARMGVSTNDSVVNSKLLVHGMKNLRIVDASVMPQVTRGNTAVPVYMIANKISDEIKNAYFGK